MTLEILSVDKPSQTLDASPVILPCLYYSSAQCNFHCSSWYRTAGNLSLLLLLELLFIPRILQVSRHLAGRVPDYHDICQLTSGILLLLFSREGLLLCLPMLCVTILCCALLLSMMYCSSRWVTGSILKRLYNYYTTQYYGST